MNQKLENLAKDFANHRGEKKNVKYPQALWNRAIEICKQQPLNRVSKALKISNRSIQRYIHLEKKTGSNLPEFSPIQIIQTESSVPIHIKGAVSITIEFNRSTEELAKLLCTLQGSL